MTPRRTSVRDAGLALISRINRWLIAGAIALAGIISVGAANSFHGHTASASSSASQSASSGASGTSSSSGSGLQQPPQAPASSGSASAPVVVSGGS